MAEVRSEFGSNDPLPRGRHRLTPEEVAANQRERMIAAVATVVDRHGYGGLTVERVIADAAVSRSTFYAHFANKREAVVAAHEAIFARFMVNLTTACGDQAEWPLKVSAAIGATVEFAVTCPEQTQILSIGSLIADAALADRISGSHGRLAVLLGGVRAHSPHGKQLPDCTEQFLVAANAGIIARYLVEGKAHGLRQLQTELVELTLLPYYGAGEAARLARVAG
jgi:AcrR family transcriptional regulator